MIVVCATDGCENNGVEIEVDDDAQAVMCGPCGADITPAA